MRGGTEPTALFVAFSSLSPVVLHHVGVGWRRFADGGEADFTIPVCAPVSALDEVYANFLAWWHVDSVRLAVKPVCVGGREFGVYPGELNCLTILNSKNGKKFKNA